MEDFIKRLRYRAWIQKFLAFLALAGAVSTVIIGADYFIYESPKIAAQDIEQQRKISSSYDAISRLSDLNASIRINMEELNIAENELGMIRSAVERDGNIGMSQIKNNYYYNYINNVGDSTNSPFANAYVDGDKKIFNITKMKLKELDGILNDIKQINVFLESKEAINRYINAQEAYPDSIRKSLQQKILYSDQLKKDLTHARDITREIGESSRLISIRDEIIGSDQEIRNLEQRIKEFDEKMSSGGFLKEAEEILNTKLQTNKQVIEQIEEFSAKVKNNLNDYKEKLPKQEELVKRLNSQKDKLDAEKQLIPLLNNEVEPILNDSKVAFYISTNIARLGIMIVTIFLAQVFISIYRYLTRISNFYHARADALEILTQTEALKNTDLSSLIEMYSNIFSPEKVDFGKMPQPPIDEVVKGAHSVFGKS
ncbi:hypothetical protein [Nitrosomonas sp.]|uniref:hypothetical protein n=1 Tax=Nitrosomonas sp. TaxID=42353 RepID=UPI0025F8FDF4|nr:hypothetical protein [Nitrosomonas sp.]